MDVSLKAEFLSIMRFFSLDELAAKMSDGLLTLSSCNRRDQRRHQPGQCPWLSVFLNQFSPLTQLANMSSTIQQTIASAERIFAVLDAEDMDETVHPAEGLKTDTKLTFKDVSFSYTDAPLIENFSLEVRCWEMVAIVVQLG